MYWQPLGWHRRPQQVRDYPNHVSRCGEPKHTHIQNRHTLFACTARYPQWCQHPQAQACACMPKHAGAHAQSQRMSRCTRVGAHPTPTHPPHPPPLSPTAGAGVVGRSLGSTAASLMEGRGTATPSYARAAAKRCTGRGGSKLCGKAGIGGGNKEENGVLGAVGGECHDVKDAVLVGGSLPRCTGEGVPTPSRGQRAAWCALECLLCDRGHGNELWSACCPASALTNNTEVCRKATNDTARVC